jgi:hypothetical protein
VTFSAGLSCLVFALIRGNDEGWGSTTIVALLVAGALLLAAFTVVERRQDQPMLDLRLFRIPTFTGAQIVAFTLHASMFSMFLYITLYMQNILGYTPLESGLRFLPISVLSFLAAPVAGKLVERYPVRLFLTAGLALIGLGLVEMHGVKPSDDWTTLLPGFILAGHRDRFREPATGRGRNRGRGAAPEWGGVRGQQHGQAGGDRGGDRRPRRDPSVQAQPRARRREPRRARGREAPTSTRSTTSSSWPPPWRSRAPPARPSSSGAATSSVRPA